MTPIDHTKDYYAILELTATADPKAIKTSYRRLALIRHPDRNQHPHATRDFQLLQEAYTTLSDPDARRQYDQGYNPTRHKSAKSNSSGGATATSSSGENAFDGSTASRTAEPEPESKSHWRTGLRKTFEERLEHLRSERTRQYNYIWESRRTLRQLQGEIEAIQTRYAEEQQEEASEQGIWGYWNWFRGVKVTTEEEKMARQRRQVDRMNAIKIKTIQQSRKKDQLEKEEASLGDMDRGIDVIRREIEALDREIQQEKAARRRAEEAERRRREAEERRRAAEEVLRKAQEWARTKRDEAQERRRREAEEQRRREDLRRTMRAFFDGMEEAEEDDEATGQECQHGGWWHKVNGYETCSECARVLRRFHFRCPRCFKVACASCRDRLKAPAPAPSWVRDDPWGRHS